MKLRKYNTNPWLWCGASLAVFLAIAATVRMPIKGENVLVARLVLERLHDLVSGDEGLAALVVAAIYLAVSGAISAVVGWFLQSIVVMAISSRYEKSR
jgi:hypothetical protein